MDFSTIAIIAVVIAVIAFFVMRRGRVAPQGTYDDRDVSSAGSIGGGPRAHDDPNVSSGGSIGGGPRTYDSPNVSSGGSIGNQATTNSTTATSRDRTPRTANPDMATNRREREEQNARDARKPIEREEERIHEDEETDEPTYNDRKLKSGGSFGSS